MVSVHTDTAMSVQHVVSCSGIYEHPISPGPLTPPPLPHNPAMRAGASAHRRCALL